MFLLNGYSTPNSENVVKYNTNIWVGINIIFCIQNNFSIWWKHKRRLMQSPCCLSAYPSVSVYSPLIFVGSPCSLCPSNFSGLWDRLAVCVPFLSLICKRLCVCVCVGGGVPLYFFFLCDSCRIKGKDVLSSSQNFLPYVKMGKKCNVIKK
jgi:hypothetical protein